MFKRTKGTELIVPVTSMNLPPGLVVCDLNTNGMVLRTRMATPLALEEKVDWYTCDTHADLKRLCSEGWIWVSCKNTISDDRDFKCENTLPCLRALPIPLQFQVVKVM